MNILLLYPEMPDTFYAMRHFLRVVGKKSAYPPLGLLTVAAMLPAHWEKRLCDLNVVPLDDRDLEWADYVFISAMNVQEKSVREIITRCKSIGKPVVAGGPLFTHEHHRFPGVDHFVLNEAEITLPWFLEDLSRGNPEPLYATNEFANIHQSPIPAFELADMSQYLYAIVQYSRGCPYLCDFCDVTALYGRRPRTKTAIQMIAELEELLKYPQIQLILFADDNLIGNKRQLKTELLPALIQWRKEKKPGFFFATQLTVNLADDEELMHLLLEAGFRHVFIGIETPDEKSLAISAKKQNLKRSLLENIRKIHRHGFIISGGFIVGFDTDDPSIFQRQRNFIQESGIPLPIVNILKAPPGTALYNRMIRENRLLRDFAFLEGETNFIPAMGEKTLYQGFLALVNDIYHPDKSMQRIMQFFNDYQIPACENKVPERFRWAHLVMLLRTLWLLGIKDAHRKYFWKLIWYGFRKNPKLLDKALFYGIMMYQMHQTGKTINQHTSRLLETIENPSFDTAGEKIASIV